MNRPLAVLALLPLVAVCASMPQTGATRQDRFWQALSSHCGKAYAGRLASDEAADADMRGMAMAMQIRRCAPTRIEVPFHVQRADGSWDRSRTWIFTRTVTSTGTGTGPSAGLRLKHDHRHEDGTPDTMTMYGGDTATPGTAREQSFPVDGESKALFRHQGRTVSLTNVWRVAVDPQGTPGAAFTYRLHREPPNARDFRVAFDLTRPIAPPPAPWGQE